MKTEYVSKFCKSKPEYRWGFKRVKIWNEKTIKLEFRCKYFSPQTIAISDRNLQNDATNLTRSGNLTQWRH